MANGYERERDKLQLSPFTMASLHAQWLQHWQQPPMLACCLPQTQTADSTSMTGMLDIRYSQLLLNCFQSTSLCINKRLKLPHISVLFMQLLLKHDPANEQTWDVVNAAVQAHCDCCLRAVCASMVPSQSERSQTRSNSMLLTIMTH